MCHRFQLLALFFLCAALFCPEPVYTAPIADVFAVWAEPEADRKTIIKYAWLENNHWTTPAVLPVHQGLHVTPVIVPGNDQAIWIIWIEQTADENILRYATIRQDKLLTGRVQETTNEQSFAPNVLRDRDGTIWITWSGVVKRFADVFTTRWHGGSWEKPQLVNTSNEAPDITPIIGQDETGNVWVSWFGFTDDHRFVQYVSDYQDNRWDSQPETLSKADRKNFIGKRSTETLQLPVDFQNRIMGAVFNGSGKAPVQSVSDHFKLSHSPRRQ